MDWKKALCERFPRLESDVAMDWERVKVRRPWVRRSRVKWSRCPFGAWLDIGIGFPALLEIIELTDLTQEAYRIGDWCPLGSQVWHGYGLYG